MKIINPFDLSIVTIEKLQQQKLIIPSKDNKVWCASIFPNSTDTEALKYYDKDKIITKIDDDMFAGFTILNKINQIVSVNNGAGKKYIKSKEIGSYDDSIKRYTVLDKPIDYNKDSNANQFLNIPKPDNIIQNDVVIEPSQLIFQPGLNLLGTKNTKKIDFLETQTLFSNPHVRPLPNTGIFKLNSKMYLEQIFKWAKSKNIQYIYCINEWRPYVISDNWTTNLVYYTIKGF